MKTGTALSGTGELLVGLPLWPTTAGAADPDVLLVGLLVLLPFLFVGESGGRRAPATGVAGGIAFVSVVRPVLLVAGGGLSGPVLAAVLGVVLLLVAAGMLARRRRRRLWRKAAGGDDFSAFAWEFGRRAADRALGALARSVVSASRRTNVGARATARPRSCAC